MNAMAPSHAIPWIAFLVLVGTVAGLIFLLRGGGVSGVARFCMVIAAGLLFGFVFLGATRGTLFSAPRFLILFAVGPAILLLVWEGARSFRSQRVAPRSPSCPSMSRLKELLAERLAPPEHARLAAHLEHCKPCQHRVEGLTAGQGSWPGMARKLTSPPPPPEPALKQVMESLKGKKEEEATRDEPVFAADLPLGFLSPPDKPDQLGRLERYEVLAEIGRGGMGVVLKAFDPSLHRVVAIKVLAPQLATSGVARKRFLREAKAAAAVTHDHIVTIHAVDEANGLPYLVMQYIPGQSLQERIDKDGPLELTEILRIGMQTASGLAAAHSHGIVHRDIKPANILLEDGVQRVKITDFGLARAMDDASLTQSGFVAGSPLFMAPEQARGEALDYRADLFSLGSVLYTMCTGRPPFRAVNTLAVLRRVTEDVPRPIRETNPEIPDWLAAVVEKLMAKEPANRFQSAAEVVDSLGQRLAQLQHAAWVPPPSPAPAPASAGAAGMPTSLTICPSCGANLHVPERMMGSVVHCSECGKPFHVEEGSEEIRVARAVGPFRPRPRHRKKVPTWGWVLLGCAAFFLFFFLITCVTYQARMTMKPALADSATEVIQERMAGGDPFWKNSLNWFPPDATLFGTIDLKPFGSLTLDDDWTQTLLGLVAPAKTTAMLTPENLGQIRIDSVAMAYYDDPKAKKTRQFVQVDGLALDGRKRALDFLRQARMGIIRIEEDVNTAPRSQPIGLSGPDLPFAVGIYGDQRVVFARAMNGKDKGPDHLQVLEELPWFDFSRVPQTPKGSLSDNHPPWVEAALEALPRDAFGVLLGEIPAAWRKQLTEGLKLRACPRTFVCSLRRDTEGVALTLSLNLEKAGGELLLLEDLEKWRLQGLDAVQAKFPALRKEPEALALFGQTLKTMRWGAKPGSRCVRTSVPLPGPTRKALRDLLQRACQCQEEGQDGG